MPSTLGRMAVLDALPHPDLADRYRQARAGYPGDPGPTVNHLDSAAAGRASAATVAAASAHLVREARLGGYVAQSQVEALVEEGRGGLAGLLGRAHGDVVFTESALSALMVLLVALRLPAGSDVWVTPGEYGPNLAVFEAFGLKVTPMPVADEAGHLDLDGVRRALRRARPTLVHLCYHGSHRGVVQPLRGLAALAREFEVPLVVDAAQGVGHLDCAVDVDAVYATSRKWLCGPRGVGVVAARPGFVPGGVGRLGSHEASVAGRVGLANAVAEHLSLGPARVRERLHATGAAVRGYLDGAGGWRVVEPDGEPSAVATLLPPQGWDDAAVEAFRGLLVREAGIVTTYAGPERAPGEARRGVLRVSPHLDVTAGQLGQLRDAFTESAARVKVP